MNDKNRRGMLEKELARLQDLLPVYYDNLYHYKETIARKGGESFAEVSDIRGRDEAAREIEETQARIRDLETELAAISVEAGRSKPLFRSDNPATSHRWIQYSVIGLMIGAGLIIFLIWLGIEAAPSNLPVAASTATPPIVITPAATETPVPTQPPHPTDTPTPTPTPSPTKLPTDTPTITPSPSPTTPPDTSTPAPTNSTELVAGTTGLHADNATPLPWQSDIYTPDCFLRDVTTGFNKFQVGQSIITATLVEVGHTGSGVALEYELDPPTDYAGWEILIDGKEGVDLSQEHILSFYVRGTQGGETANIWLMEEVEGGGFRRYYRTINDYRPITDQWQQVNIPLVDFTTGSLAQEQIDLTHINKIQIVFEWYESPVAGTIYIDDACVY